MGRYTSSVTYLRPINDENKRIKLDDLVVRKSLNVQKSKTMIRSKAGLSKSTARVRTEMKNANRIGKEKLVEGDDFKVEIDKICQIVDSVEQEFNE